MIDEDEEGEEEEEEEAGWKMEMDKNWKMFAMAKKTLITVRRLMKKNRETSIKQLTKELGIN